MKKILFILIILFCAITSVFANTNDSLVPTSSEQEKAIALRAKYIIDNASLLTDEQALILEAKSAEIKQKYNFDVVILTILDISGQAPMTYSSNFFHSNNYSENGIIFLISMAERDFDISAFNYGKEVFTDDYGLDYIIDKITPPLSDGDYNKSFSNFLHYAETFLLEAESGTPYSADNKLLPKNIIMLIVVVLALAISIFTIMYMRGQMNTKNVENLAYGYLNRESANIIEKDDTFLYKTVTKTEKPEENFDDDDFGSSSGDSSSRSGGRSGKF